jgi:hypothetical protein
MARERARISAEASARRRDLAQRTRHIQELEDRLLILRDRARAHPVFINMIAEYPEGVPRSKVARSESDFPPGARLFGAIGPVTLLVPRRGGAGGDSHREHGTGQLLISSDAMLFRGDARIEEWPLARVASMRVLTDRLFVALTGRRTISGLKAHPVYIEIIQAVITWRKGESASALEHLRSSSERAQAELVRLEAELGVARSYLEAQAADVPGRATKSGGTWKP